MAKRISPTARHVVAAGVVTGRKTGAIARDLGVTRRTVQRIAADDQTLLIVTDVLRPLKRKLEKLATRAAYVVEKAMLAHHTDKADHVTRLKAVERYGELLSLAQGKLAAEQEVQEKQTFTWEEFEVMYYARRAKSAQENSQTITVKTETSLG